MVLDVPGRVVMLLVDVPVEDGHIGEWKQQIDRLLRVARRPIPLRIQIEEGRCARHDDPRVGLELREVVLEPRDLRITKYRGGVGDVVQRDEVDPLVVEGVMHLSEDLLIDLPLVGGGVVLPGM